MTATAPATVAARLDAIHARLGREIDQAMATAQAAIDAGLHGVARDCMAEVRTGLARQAEIEACWVPKAVAA